MKRFYTLSVIFTAILTSCGGVKPISTEEVVHEIGPSSITRGSVDRDLFTSDRLDTIASTITYEFYTNPAIPAEDTVNYYVKRYVNGSITFGEYSETNSELSDAFMVAALDSLEKMYYDEMSQYEEDEYFGGVWAVDFSNSIDETHSEYIQLAISSWAYTGGAHGNGWSHDMLVDRKTGKVLLLSDFFTDVDALTRLAEPIFRASQGLELDSDLEEAGYWFDGGVFHLNENFIFTGESIEFLYNQYEIASYAAGPISVSIPREQFKHLLKRKID